MSLGTSARSMGADRHEHDRIATLRKYDFLGNGHRTAFDRIARIAARSLGAASAAVSLVESDWIRFVGTENVPAEGLPRTDDAFCHHVVAARTTVVASDASSDPRFCNHPLVVDASVLPGGAVRFYAGAPIVVEGLPLGAVWILGYEPRADLTPDEREILEDLAAAAARELENGAAHGRLTDLFDHAVDAIFTLSHEGAIMSLNPAFERVTGHARQDWLGRSFAPLVHPDDRQAVAEGFERALRGEEVALELRVLAPDGKARSLEAVAAPRVTGGVVTQVFGFARDIGERKESEARMREQAELLAERESRLERLARASTDAMWDMDPDNHQIWWSEGFQTLFGYPVDAYATADQWEERIHPEDIDRVLTEHQRAIDAHESTWQDEYRYLCADGTFKYVVDRAHIEYDEDGNLRRIYGGMVDITARKEAELALQRSEELFRSLYANAPIGIYRTTPGGKVLMANDALVRMLGFESFEDLARRDLGTEGYDSDHPREAFQQRVEAQAAVEGFEAVWLKKDGTPLVVREHARAIRGDDGGVLHYEGTVEDVTEQRRFEDALRRLVDLPAGYHDELFTDLAEATAEALGTRWAVLVRPSADGRLEVVADHGLDLPVVVDSCEPLVHAIQGSAVEILAGLPFHCEDGCGFLLDLDATALVAMPVRNSLGELIGALAVLHDEPLPRPTVSDRWLLTAFAQRTGAELEERDHLHRLEATSRAADALRSAESVEEVYRRATSEVLQATAARSVAVNLYDPSRDRLEVEFAAGAYADQLVGRTLERGQGISWSVFDPGKPRFVPDLTQEENAVFLAGDVRAGAWAGAPLVDQQGNIFGLLTADTVGGTVFRNMSRPDLYYVEAIAQAIGVSVARLGALDRARTEGERFRALAELSAQLELIDEPIDIARTALEQLLPLTGFTFGSMWTVNGSRVRKVLSVGTAGREIDHVFVDRDLHEEGGVLGDVVAGKETVWIPEYDKHPGALPTYVSVGLRSLLATPLMQDDEVYGVLVLDTFDRSIHLSQETRSLLQAVAHRVQRALQRASSRHELVATREEALRALGLALEYRDYETKGHTDRVTELALQLGAELGLDEEHLKKLRWGAYLHDTGKVSIPDHILLKPGKLNPAEWRRMKEHVTIGEAMLHELGFIPNDVLEIVRHHHERWDGTGYPDGIAGPDIPLMARVFAVADVYDALTSERPYKDAWLPSEALAEIESQSGKQFDPGIVGTFLRYMSRRNRPA